jgi:hypothetical protein
LVFFLEKMAKSEQTHIFATRSDLVPGLARAEAELGIQYARCGRYCSSEFEQYSSLVEWEGLGKNTTGDHMSGAQFLATPKSKKIIMETVAPTGRHAGRQNGIVVDDAGRLSRSALSPDKASAFFEHGTRLETPPQQSDSVYFLSQKLNPDSLVFSPGGVYKDQPAIVAGHIGTISQSNAALTLYKSFVEAITKGFEKIGNYYAGPEAERLMRERYRMITISVGSPAIYDLKRK